MSKPIMYHLHITNINDSRDRDEDYYEENLWMAMHHLTRFISNLSGKLYHPWHSMKYIKSEAEKHGIDFTIKKIYNDRWKIEVSEITWDWDSHYEHGQESEEDEKESA